MKINVQGTEYEATPENSIIFTGPTLVNGLYVDLDEDYYFVPEELPIYPELALTAKYEGVTVMDLQEYDPEAQPFCFIINALCRVFAQEVEIVTDRIS